MAAAAILCDPGNRVHAEFVLPADLLEQPAAITAGSPDSLLTVLGSGFGSGTVVYFNTTALTTSYVNPGQVQATIPASLLTAPATASITVRNLNGTVSNPWPLTVTTTPVITDIGVRWSANNVIGARVARTASKQLIAGCCSVIPMRSTIQTASLVSFGNPLQALGD